MQAELRAVEDIFGLWPSVAEFARDIDVPFDRARKWGTYGRIPTQYWPSVIEAAQRREIDLSPGDILATCKPYQPRRIRRRNKRARAG